MGRPATGRTTETLTVRLPKSVIASLKGCAESQGVTVNEKVSELLKISAEMFDAMERYRANESAA